MGMATNTDGAQTAIVVVGAGRSGTSTATRAVQALGAELGGRLKGASRKNPKGFFEDEDFIRINYRIRDVFGLKRSGAGVSVIPPEHFDDPALEPIVRDAAAIIRERFGDYPLWGFKAGGVLSFLPFWERVFAETGQNVRYVLALRNPLAVADSRSKVSQRRGLQANSDLEFLARVVPYFRRAAEHPLAVMEYDRVIADARTELYQVARRLGLPMSAEREAGIAAFADEFVSGGLRHHGYDAKALNEASDLNHIARDAYRSLYALASGDWTLEDASFWDAWARVEYAHGGMAPALAHIDALEGELRRMRRGPAGMLSRLGERLSQRARRRASAADTAGHSG